VKKLQRRDFHRNLGFSPANPLLFSTAKTRLGARETRGKPGSDNGYECGFGGRLHKKFLGNGSSGDSL
jgi:hypothetical protein